MVWNSFPTLIAFAAVLFILLQSIYFLRHPNGSRMLWLYGLITILLTIVAVVGLLLYISDSFVLSPEFGLILVQGTWGRVGFAVMLLCLALILALGWIMARLDAGWPLHWKRLVLLAVLAWLGSVIRISGLNLAGPGSLPLYTYYIWWPVGVAWLVLASSGSVMAALRQSASNWLAGYFALALVAVGVYASLFPPQFADPLSVNLWLAVTLAAGISLFGWLGAILIRRLVCLFRQDKASRAVTLHTNLFLENLKHYRLEEHQVIILISLGLIMSGALGMLYTDLLPGHLTGLFLFLIGWMVLSETFTHSWMNQIYVAWRQGKIRETETEIVRDLAAARGWLKRVGQLIWSGVKAIFSVPNKTVAILKAVILILIIIVINEYQDSGKTIIQPFTAAGFDDKAHLADSVSARIVNTLEVLNQQLQPDIIIPSSSLKINNRSAFSNNTQVAYIRPTGSASTVDTVLDKSDSLDFGLIKIPPSLFVAPFQNPLRSLFGVHVISGTLMIDGNRYVVLGTSDNGYTWNARAANNSDQAIPGLADQVAFDMLNSQANLQNLGITQSWEAFQAFQQGIQSMQKFEYSQDYEQLTAAIQSFDQAIAKDNQFGLAYYRLGLALQSDLQPALAEKAFLAGLALMPNFIPLQNTLAYHLYYYDNYIPAAAAAVEPLELPSQKDPNNLRPQRAARLWRQVISAAAGQANPADRASAFNGLCQVALDAAQTASQNGDQDQADYERAYFYCKRAEVTYSDLPAILRNSPEIRQAQATTLDTLGVVMEGSASAYDQDLNQLADLQGLDGWNCRSQSFNKGGQRNPYYLHYSPGSLRAALHYYNLALAINPGDQVIQCNAAVDEAFLGNPQPMLDLDADPAVHLNLADGYMGLAEQDNFNPQGNQPSPYYQQAFSEYQKALDLDPLNQNALNGFAYTYWIYRLRYPQTRLQPQAAGLVETADVAATAETYAREAARLAQANPIDRITYADTLAEALMANRKPQEAIDTLQPLFENGSVPDHPSYDEIRWDMAQAYLCAASRKDITLDKGPAYISKAHYLLDLILVHERDRDYQPFTSYAKGSLLNVGQPLPSCAGK